MALACSLAPLYARHVAHTGPNAIHLTDRVRVSGRLEWVVEPGAARVSANGGLASYRPPASIGPTMWYAGGRFVLGADSLGRDVAVRLLYGGRFTFLVGLAATAITVALALLLALVSGFHGGSVDWWFGRLFDLVWAMPTLLVAIALAASLSFSGFHHFGVDIGPNSVLMPILIIGLLRVPYAARPLRARVLELVERPFIEAARAQGARPRRIMVSELLPNLTTDLATYVPLLFAGNIILEASIEFLDGDIGAIGPTPPDPSWGTMIAGGDFVFPGIALFLAGLSLNVFGAHLRDAFDPYQARISTGRVEEAPLRRV
jgi:peptide/nickel transport system permease protein